MQARSACQLGRTKMTQQVRAVTLYFWSHYSGSYPVATTHKCRCMTGLKPKSIREQHGVADTTWCDTRAGFLEDSQPQVLVDNQHQKSLVRTLTE